MLECHLDCPLNTPPNSRALLFCCCWMHPKTIFFLSQKCVSLYSEPDNTYFLGCWCCILRLAVFGGLFVFFRLFVWLVLARLWARDGYKYSISIHSDAFFPLVAAPLCMCVCVGVCVRARARVRACVCVCARARVRVRDVYLMKDVHSQQ